MKPGVQVKLSVAGSKLGAAIGVGLMPVKASVTGSPSGSLAETTNEPALPSTNACGGGRTSVGGWFVLVTMSTSVIGTSAPAPAVVTAWNVAL